MKHIQHNHKAAEKIMVKNQNSTVYGSPEFDGAYTIATVNDNGTVRIWNQNYYEVMNIRNVKP